MDAPELALSWTADHNLVAAPTITGSGVLVAGRDKALRLLDFEGRERWLLPLARGASAAPALWGPLGFVADESGALQAVTLSTGALRWTAELGAPAVGDLRVIGRVLVLGAGAARPGAEGGGVAAVDAASGAILWQHPIPEGCRAPASDDGHCAILGASDGAVYSLHLGTGRVNWRAEVGAPVLGGAAVFGDLAAVPVSDGSLRGLALDSGAERWRLETGGPLLRQHALPDGDRVLLGASDGHLRCIDAATGTVRWEVRRDGKHQPGSWSTPARLDGAVAAAVDLGDRSSLVGLHPATGELLWERDLPGSTPSALVERDGWLAVTMAHGKQLHLLRTG